MSFDERNSPPSPDDATVSPADFRSYSAPAALRDGSSILIRAIRPDDKQRLLAHFRALSADSRRYRFMGMRRDLTTEELARLCEVDFLNHVALVATLGSGDDERFIGVGRSIRSSDPRRAEVAFAVLDEYQGRGIGTLLLEHLSRIARMSGIEEFEADVLGDNKAMLDVFEQSGFRVRRSFSSGVVHVRFPTDKSPE
jgi:GNAT superfamily N-acetyltransferase